eukprot:362377-Chlamydomonas_euryale.AAC.4
MRSVARGGGAGVLPPCRALSTLCAARAPAGVDTKPLERPRQLCSAISMPFALSMRCHPVGWTPSPCPSTPSRSWPRAVLRLRGRMRVRRHAPVCPSGPHGDVLECGPHACPPHLRTKGGGGVRAALSPLIAFPPLSRPPAPCRALPPLCLLPAGDGPGV